jgi:hypothetical protein
MKVLDINESTRLPLGWTISIISAMIGGVIGGMFWLTMLYSDVAYAKRDLHSLENKVDQKLELLNKLDRRMARIEVKLGIISDESK